MKNESLLRKELSNIVEQNFEVKENPTAGEQVSSNNIWFLLGAIYALLENNKEPTQ